MDALNHRLFRAKMDETQRKIYNEKVKLRMREYRKRKKESGELTRKHTMTRKQVEKQRAYWREKKRQQRSNMSEMKKREEAFKRRERYQAAKKKLQFSPTKESIRKASERMKIPNDPTKCAEAVNNVINRATPRKKRSSQRKRSTSVTQIKKDK